MCIGTRCSRASAVASVTSLWARRSAKEGGSNLFSRKLAPGDRTWLTTDRALADRLPERQRLHTGLDAQRERFGQGALDHVPGAVVDQLGDRAGPMSPTRMT